MIESIKKHVLAWATAAAASIAGIQIFNPFWFFDTILDVMMVVLVAVAAKLASLDTKK